MKIQCVQEVTDALYAARYVCYSTSSNRECKTVSFVLIRCTVGYLEQEESRAFVLQSFLAAHYFGVASLLDDAKREQIAI